MNNYKNVFLTTVLLLFFVQQLAMLVESVYMLNLLHTGMDARALAILFLYAGIFLVFFKTPGAKAARNLGLLFLFVGAAAPWMPTEWRILASGVSVALFMLFLGVYAGRVAGAEWLLGATFALLLSIALRALGATQDISLVGSTRIIGALLALAGAFLLVRQFCPDEPCDDNRPRDSRSGVSLFAAAVGFMCSLFFLYAVLFTPAVISRWSGVDYRLIHAVLTSTLVGVVWMVARRGLLFRPWVLPAWNIVFLVAVLVVILRNTVSFPPGVDSAPVVVRDAADAVGTIAVILMLLSSPVVLVNNAVYFAALAVNKPARLAPSLAFSGLVFSVLVFMLIFTNVWGYVGEASGIFRNKFYLPFLLAGLGMTLPYLRAKSIRFEKLGRRKLVALAAILGGVSLAAVPALESMPPAVSKNKDALTVMTYNIQQGVNVSGVKSYERQLQVIRRVDPDVLCLQESDVARISSGGSDVVRYFAEKLKYYVYYGPKTVTGTFGTSILSRHPLRNGRTIFTYSDVDEIGTAYAEIEFGGKVISIYNNHPAGAAALQAHVDMLCDEVRQKKNVIAAGDFNFTLNTDYYRRIAGLLQESWRAARPDETHPAMPDRIDYIFASHDFNVLQSIYLPAPQSQSDHPAHWAVLEIKAAK